MTAVLHPITKCLLTEVFAQPELDGRNIVLSPHSVRSALSLLALGAKGPTRDELLTFLGAAGEDDLRASLTAAAAETRSPESPLRSATGLFASEAAAALRPEFADLARQLSSHVESLSFTGEGAARKINDWVSEATSGRITDLVSTLHASLVLLVLSALHFQSEWAQKFNPGATIDRPFSLRSGGVVQRRAMHMTLTCPAWIGPEWKMVELPYRASDFAMVLALPNDPGALRLDLDALSTGIDALEPTLVALQLPRFEIGLDLSLAAPLQRAGVRLAFDASGADFSGAVSGPAFVSDVLHKAWIAVTEEGTEAAAATAIPLVRSMDRRPKVPFVIDRPFWFVLRDKRDGDILFVGRVEDPKGA